MKIEFLSEGSSGFPLVRLFEYQPSDVASLRDACMSLAEGRSLDFQLDTQPWARPIDGCRLVLRTNRKNHGLWMPPLGLPFTMECNAEGWLEVAEKLGAFILNVTGFQWLTNEGDVRVLISPDGRW